MNKPLKIAITGQIGTGKSFVSDVLKNWGYAVYESDLEVKKLYNNPKFIKKILSEFKDSVENIETEKGKINKEKLSLYVFDNKKDLRKLEKIVHPILQNKQIEFIKTHKGNNKLFFDIPLLFQKKLHLNFDLIIYTTASKRIQKDRVMKRPEMTYALFKKILINQNIEKKLIDEFVSLKIDTSRDKKQSKLELKGFLEQN